MDRIYNITNLYVATLRSIYLVHQQNHWISKGIAFYADHLLFERLYKSAQENADLAAEKFIGLFGNKAVSFKLQNELINKILSRYEGNSTPLEMSLNIEKDFLDLSQEAYDAFKEENAMTLGLDDAIMSIASDRETSIYLINQTLSNQE